MQIRAVYRSGHFEPLEPVNMIEGREVNLVIVENDLKTMSGDLLVISEDELEPVSEDELAWVRQQLSTIPPLSDLILDERDQQI